MHKVFLAAAVANLASTAAVADSMTIGDAHRAPVFANASGTSALVAEVGRSNAAPVFTLSSSGRFVAEVGNASRAPVFVQARGPDADLALAR